MYYSCCFVFLKTGEQSEPPTQAILEKQRLVLEGLREKLELNISNVDKLPAAELQQVVDKAVSQVSSMIIYQLFRNEMSLELLFQTYNLT